jgi:hypothetical protein
MNMARIVRMTVLADTMTVLSEGERTDRGAGEGVPWALKSSIVIMDALFGDVVHPGYIVLFVLSVD